MIRRQTILLIILLIVGCDNSTEPEDCAGVAGGDSVEDVCGEYKYWEEVSDLSPYPGIGCS